MDISRRGFLKKASILLSTATISLLVLNCSNKPSKQNVLFIAIDDLNDWIGCLSGHPQARTPNIDRLAKQGILFTNAHCAVPICGPSRAAIFTGKHPWNTGIFTNDNEALKKIGREFQTLPQSLRNAGTTHTVRVNCYMGKWIVIPKISLLVQILTDPNMLKFGKH